MTSSIRSSVGIAATVVLVACLASGLGGGSAADAATPTPAPVSSTSAAPASAAAVTPSPVVSPVASAAASPVAAPAAVPSPTPTATTSTSATVAAAAQAATAAAQAKAAAQATAAAQAAAAAQATASTTDPSLAQQNAAGNHTMGSTIPGSTVGTVAPKAQSRLMTPKAAARPSGLPGMDVSAYQHNVDWATSWANGARFAYVKATEGTTYSNAYFAQQYNGSYAQGMTRGAYHFAHPDSASGAVAQAKYFVANGGGWSPDGRTLPPLLDIEYGQASQGGSCWGLSQAAMVTWIGKFVNTVTTLTGTKPAIYTTTNWWKTCTGNSAAFSSNPLFVAYYTSGASAGPMPASWSNYTFWQFQAAGLLPGDQDVFRGSAANLKLVALGSQSVAVKPVVPAAVVTVPAGKTLTSGAAITSPNKQYRLQMQGDGNLVLRGNGRALWYTKTQGNPNARFVIQGDGNAVVYSAAGRPLWQSGTAKSGSRPAFTLSSGGELTVTTSNGVVWTSGLRGTDTVTGVTTLLPGHYLHDTSGAVRAIMQSDGNFVLYVAGKAKWSSRTWGNANARLVLQSDGNLVVYSKAGKPLWNSHTWGTGFGNKLVMQGDGNLVLFNKKPHWIWMTHTKL